MAVSTADQVREIANSSENQSQASNALNANTEEMGHMARDTADRMHEAQAAVKEISNLVAQIQKVVDTLKR